MRLLGSRVPHSAGGDKLPRATVLLSPSAHAHGSSLSTGSFFCCHIQVDQSKKKMGRWKDRKESTHLLALTWVITMLGSPGPLLLYLPVCRCYLLCSCLTFCSCSLLCAFWLWFSSSIQFHLYSMFRWIPLPEFWSTEGTSSFPEKMILSENLEWRERCLWDFPASWVGRSEVTLPGLWHCSAWCLWNNKCFSWATENGGRLEGCFTNVNILISP